MSKLWSNNGEVRHFSKVRSNIAFERHRINNTKNTGKQWHGIRDELTLATDGTYHAYGSSCMINTINRRLVSDYIANREGESHQTNREPDCNKCGWKILYGEELIRTTNNNMDPTHYHIWCRNCECVKCDSHALSDI